MIDIATGLNIGSIICAVLGLILAGIRYAKSKKLGDDVYSPLVLGLMVASALQIANMLMGKA